MKTRLCRLLAAPVLLLALVPFVGAIAPSEPVKPVEPLPRPAVDPAVEAKIEPLLFKELAASDTTTFLVYLHQTADLRLAQAQPDKLGRRRAVVQVLQETAQRTQAPILAYLERQKAAGHVTDMTSYWIFNGFAVTGDRETLLALAARPDVERILANHLRRLDDEQAGEGSSVADVPAPEITEGAVGEHQNSPSLDTVEWNISKVRAPEVWSTFGIEGQGVVVANMDTGVYYQHPALLQKYRGYSSSGVDHNYNWADFTYRYPDQPKDGHGHGTHTMGTLVGSDGGANQIGVAPGATWIAVKVFNDSGYAYDSAIHSGFQWIMAPTDLSGHNPDPSKAPDICSNSWGSSWGDNQTFWQDVLNWRAAGIMPIFSAGNSGPYAFTIGSPASFPQSFAVGATDAEDDIAYFSSRGPSPWGEVKPEISAPGVNIRSSVPPAVSPLLYSSGWNGTSMAAPHVAGAAALILKARPELTITETEFVLTSTAYMPPGLRVPNNDYGWGRLDVFQAVAAVANGGRIWGRVADDVSGEPIAGAQITMRRQDSVGSAQTATDARGYYTFTVGAGLYQMTASALWYGPRTVDNVEVQAGFTTVRDFGLTRLDRGVLRGRVTGNGAPITATISISDFPLTLVTDASGVYSATLPVGSYDVHARPNTGYRRSTQRATIASGSETILDFNLAAAPRILLVDADAWEHAGDITYYQNDLDALFYTYDTWSVSSYPVQLPPTETIKTYDLVIWYQGATSPGYVYAWPRLAAYLDNGGRLLLTGQDIAYWDAFRGYASTYFRTYLHSQYLRESNLPPYVRWSDDLFLGITLTVNAPDSANNQSYPDVIGPIDTSATPVFNYATATVIGGVAGARIETSAYRAIYLAFGLEGVGPRATRQETLKLAIAWLTLPGLHKTAEPAGVAPGDVVTFTLALSNAKPSTAASLTISDPVTGALHYVDGSARGGLVYDAQQAMLGWQGSMPANTTMTFTFQARVGADVPLHTRVTNRAYLQDGSGESVPATAAVLVDLPDLSLSRKIAEVGTTASGQEITYTIILTNTRQTGGTVVALDTLPVGVSYIEGSASPGAIYNPASKTVEWVGSIAPAGPPEADYTFTTSDQPGGPTFAWIDITTTGRHIATGDDTISGPYDIGFPFPFYGEERSQFYLSSNGWLSFRQSGHSNYVYSCLPSAYDLPLALAMFWTDLYPGRSSQGVYYWTNNRDTLVVSFVDVPHYGAYDSYTFQAILRADGTITYQYRTMIGHYANDVAIGVQDDNAVRGTNVTCGQSFVHDYLAVRLTPPQPSRIAASFRFRARVDDGLPLHTIITNTAVASNGIMSYTLAATCTVNTIDLTPSTLEADKGLLSLGDTLNYTLTVRNSGTTTSTAYVTDVLPLQVTYVPGSAGDGIVYDEATRSLLWSGTVAAGAAVPLTFAAAPNPELADGTLVTNTAVVADMLGRRNLRSASTLYRVHDLTQSRLEASASNTWVGNVVTFTVIVVNSGYGPSNFVVTDTLPVGLVYLPGTMDVAYGSASYDASQHRIIWRGRIQGKQQTYLRYAVYVDASANLINTVVIQDNAGRLLERSLTLRNMAYRILFETITANWSFAQ